MKSENLCDHNKRKMYSKLTKKNYFIDKKVYDSKLLEKLMVGCS